MDNCKFENGNVIIPLKEVEKLVDNYRHLVQCQKSKTAREYFAGKADLLADILFTYQKDCITKHQE